jgi:hypothetical protein
LCLGYNVKVLRAAAEPKSPLEGLGERDLSHSGSAHDMFMPFIPHAAGTLPEYAGESKNYSVDRRTGWTLKKLMGSAGT